VYAEDCSMGTTLKFSDPDLEKQFQNQKITDNLFVPRLIYLSGSFLYAVFFVLDVFLLKNVIFICAFIRFLIVCPSLLVSYFMLGKPLYKKYRTSIEVFNGFAASGGILVMISIANPPGSHLYYGGLLLCCLFFYVFEPRQIISNVLSWGTFFSYCIVAMCFTETPSSIFLNNVFIFFFFNIGAMFACYSIELFQRKEFLQKITIQDQSDRLYQALCEVDLQREKAEKLSLLDPLTGLANRRHFFSVLQVELGKSVRTQTPLSLMLIDIDYFKEVNDRFGHVAGDKVLALVAVILQDSVRPGDAACRYGGEEFAVLLPDSDRNVAEKVALRLMEKIRCARIPVGSEQIALSISVGIAALTGGSSKTMEDLVRQADEALYAAKNSGRNQVCLADEDYHLAGAMCD